MSDHKTEIRPREITTTYCVEDGCQFKGDPAVQGHCYSRESELLDMDKLDVYERESDEELAKIRRDHYPDAEEYIRWLESHYQCVSMNWSSTLDECVYLRAENARLRKATQPRPKVKLESGTELDWQAAEKAANGIIKQCQDAYYCPPEALDIHLMRAKYVCREIDAIAAALKLQGPREESEK